MHIAICDDNVADRKQTERLMGREADKWISKGDPLYIYSYGSAGSLLANAMEYDGIFLDIRSEDLSTKELIEKLMDAGVNACIVVSNESDFSLCHDDGKIEIENEEKIEIENKEKIEIENEEKKDGDNSLKIMCLEKPINPSKLHEILEQIKTYRQEHDTSRIELRGENETLYVNAEEILYGELFGYGTKVFLTEGRCIKINVLPSVFFDEIEGLHDTFALPAYGYLINIAHISSIRFSTATMDDGRKFKISGATGKYIKYIFGKLECK